MRTKITRLAFFLCLLATDIATECVGQQQNTNSQPCYYMGLKGHFSDRQDFSNAGLIIDDVAADSPFKKMEGLDGQVRSLRKGERVSSLGDGAMSPVRDYYNQIEQAKHHHGRMWVSVHSASNATAGEMFLFF